jgi:hypothetical protein
MISVTLTSASRNVVSSRSACFVCAGGSLARTRSDAPCLSRRGAFLCVHKAVHNTPRMCPTAQRSFPKVWLLQQLATIHVSQRSLTLHLGHTANALPSLAERQATGVVTWKGGEEMNDSDCRRRRRRCRRINNRQARKRCFRRVRRLCRRD